MDTRTATLTIALGLLTVLLLPAGSATEIHVDADLATTQDDEIPVCVTTPSPDPKGEEEICVAVIHVPDLCVTTPSPDPKGEKEICFAATQGSRDVTVDTTKLGECVGPWTTEVTVDTGVATVTVITCDPFYGESPW